MTVISHYIGRECPYCGLKVFRSPKSVTRQIVFCATAGCFAGGFREDRPEQETPLALGFVTETQVEEMLREMGVTREEIAQRK